MAQQLESQGHRVGLLVVFDSGPPKTLGSSPVARPRKSLIHYARRSLFHFRRRQLSETLLAWASQRKVVRYAFNRCARIRERAAGGPEIGRLQRLELGFRRAGSTYIAQTLPGANYSYSQHGVQISQA